MISLYLVTKVVPRLLETLVQSYARFPTEGGIGPLHFGFVLENLVFAISPFAIFNQTGAARDPLDTLQTVAHRDNLAGTDVPHVALSAGHRQGTDDCLHSVLDINEIAGLLSQGDLNVAILCQRLHDLGDELPVSLSRTVYHGGAQNDCRQSERVG